MGDGKLFPEYLNMGSQGPAVAALQLILKTLGCDQMDIIIDGDYGAVTAAAVGQLQMRLGVKQDGHFGPVTRRAFRSRYYGLDVNDIPADVFGGETKAVTPT